MKKALIVILVLAFIVSACSLGGSKTDPKLDRFASCLTEKGAKMYGAFWCSHCKAQKEEFGSSWEKIIYIECSLPSGQGQTEICTQAGIEGYPTWEFADGTRKSGELSLEYLASKTGCSLE